VDKPDQLRESAHGALHGETRQEGQQRLDERSEEGEEVKKTYGGTESDGVEVEVLEAVVVEEGTRGGVDVGEGVLAANGKRVSSRDGGCRGKWEDLRLAVLGEDTGSDLVELVDVPEGGKEVSDRRRQRRTTTTTTTKDDDDTSTSPLGSAEERLT
jgi:hypothetical protein